MIIISWLNILIFMLFYFMFIRIRRLECWFTRCNGISAWSRVGKRHRECGKQISFHLGSLGAEKMSHRREWFFNWVCVCINESVIVSYPLLTALPCKDFKIKLNLMLFLYFKAYTFFFSWVNSLFKITSLWDGALRCMIRWKSYSFTLWCWAFMTHQQPQPRCLIFLYCMKV